MWAGALPLYTGFVQRADDLMTLTHSLVTLTKHTAGSVVAKFVQCQGSSSRSKGRLGRQPFERWQPETACHQDSAVKVLKAARGT